jgi:hypothetical protein
MMIIFKFIIYGNWNNNNIYVEKDGETIYPELKSSMNITNN